MSEKPEKSEKQKSYRGSTSRKDLFKANSSKITKTDHEVSFSADNEQHTTSDSVVQPEASPNSSKRKIDKSKDKSNGEPTKKNSPKDEAIPATNDLVTSSRPSSVKLPRHKEKDQKDKEKDQKDKEKDHKDKEKDKEHKDKEKEHKDHKDKKDKKASKDSSTTKSDFPERASSVQIIDNPEIASSRKARRSPSVANIRKSQTIDPNALKMRLEEQESTSPPSSVKIKESNETKSSSSDSITMSPRSLTTPLSPPKKQKKEDTEASSSLTSSASIPRDATPAHADGVTKRRSSRAMSSKRISKSKSLRIPAPNNRTIAGELLQYSQISSGYWAEGFSGPPVPPNIDDLFAIHDDRRDALLFPLQNFNNHYEYHSQFANVPHVNFLGIDNDIGPIIISITQEAFNSDGGVSPRRSQIGRQLSEKSLKGPPKLFTNKETNVWENDESSNHRGLSPTSSQNNMGAAKESHSPGHTGISPTNSNVLRSESQRNLKSSPAFMLTGQAQATSMGSHGTGQLSHLQMLHVMMADESLGSYRALIRCKLGDVVVKIPAIHTKRKYPKGHTLLNALISCHPEVPFSWEKVEFKESSIPKEAIVQMEYKLLPRHYKFGVIFARSGQSTDNQMLANSEGSEAFEKFMSSFSKKIELKSWPGFTGGLDVAHGTTGKYSYYTKFRDYEIMFHVSVCLPHVEGDEQQLEKKRHIGNDVVVIVFQDGDTPITPSTIKSYFNHVFFIVHPIKPPSENTAPNTPNSTGTPTSTETHSTASDTSLNGPSIPDLNTSDHSDRQDPMNDPYSNINKLPPAIGTIAEDLVLTDVSAPLMQLDSLTDSLASTRISRSATADTSSSPILAPPVEDPIGRSRSPSAGSPLIERSFHQRFATDNSGSPKDNQSITPTRSPRIDDCSDEVPPLFIDPVTAAAMPSAGGPPKRWDFPADDITLSSPRSPRHTSAPRPRPLLHREEQPSTAPTMKAFSGLQAGNLSSSEDLLHSRIPSDDNDSSHTKDTNSVRDDGSDGGRVESDDSSHVDSIKADDGRDEVGQSRRNTRPLLSRRLSQGSSTRQLIKSTRSGKLSKALPQIQRAKLNVQAKERMINPPPQYRIEVVCKEGTISSSPPLPQPPVFTAGPYFREFFLTKLINAERAAYFSPHFAKPIERTRELLLQGLLDTKP